MKLSIFNYLLFSPSYILTLPFKKQNGANNYFPYVHLSNSNPFIYERITDFVVFGDSYSQVNTNLTDMSYTGKNRSRGKNWPVQLIDLHPMKMWNFAEAGATVDMSIINRDSHDFKTQCHNFTKLIKDKKTTGEWGKVGLFAIWIGSNDIRSMDRKIQNKEEIYDRIMIEMFKMIDVLYQKGARNLLIINVPPLEKIPFNKDGSFNEVSVDVDYMNNLLSKNIQSFADTHSDTNIFLYDIHHRINEIINHCTQYKFKDCRSDWRKHKIESIKLYFWSDLSHPTYQANEFFSNDIHGFLTITSKLKFLIYKYFNYKYIYTLFLKKFINMSYIN